jgi:Na+/H+ antiporter NhaD/arsenite permease-like protein
MKEPLVKRIWLFYYEGFKSMTLGKTLWAIILIKLFIMFFVLKLFFFKSELSVYSTKEEKSKHVIEKLTE